MITRYEIAATHPDGRKWLIGYTPRKSRIGLLLAMQKHGQAIIDRLAIRDDLTFGEFVAQPLPHVMCDAWRIGFTGRTQLYAKRAGELPFVAA